MSSPKSASKPPTVSNKRKPAKNDDEDNEDGADEENKKTKRKPKPKSDASDGEDSDAPKKKKKKPNKKSNGSDEDDAEEEPKSKPKNKKQQADKDGDESEEKGSAKKSAAGSKPTKPVYTGDEANQLKQKNTYERDLRTWEKANSQSNFGTKANLEERSDEAFFTSELKVTDFTIKPVQAELGKSGVSRNMYWFNILFRGEKANLVKIQLSDENVMNSNIFVNTNNATKVFLELLNKVDAQFILDLQDHLNKQIQEVAKQYEWPMFSSATKIHNFIELQSPTNADFRVKYKPMAGMPLPADLIDVATGQKIELFPPVFQAKLVESKREDGGGELQTEVLDENATTINPWHGNFAKGNRATLIFSVGGGCYLTNKKGSNLYYSSRANTIQRKSKDVKQKNSMTTQCRIRSAPSTTSAKKNYGGFVQGGAPMPSTIMSLKTNPASTASTSATTTTTTTASEPESGAAKAALKENKSEITIKKNEPASTAAPAPTAMPASRVALLTKDPKQSPPSK